MEKTKPRQFIPTHDITEVTPTFIKTKDLFFHPKEDYYQVYNGYRLNGTVIPIGIKTAKDFVSELRNRPKIPFLIDQLLPDSTDPMIVCGRPQIGKTNLSLYMAFCLATGQPIFSFKTQQCKVGYLFMEGGAQQIATRVEKLSNHFVGIPDSLFIDQVDPMPLNDKGQARLSEITYSLKVCFLDSLKYIIPGDYMKPADVLKGLSALAIIQQATGCTFILIGHIRKPDRKVVSDPDDYWTELKGPTEYLEMANSAILLTRPRHIHGEAGQFQPVSPDDRQLFFIKARDADRELLPLALKFYREELLFRPQLIGRDNGR